VVGLPVTAPLVILCTKRSYTNIVRDTCIIHVSSILFVTVFGGRVARNRTPVDFVYKEKLYRHCRVIQQQVGYILFLTVLGGGIAGAEDDEDVGVLFVQ
jgi:hypothetical protein